MEMQFKNNIIETIIILSIVYLIMTFVLPETHLLLWLIASLIVINYGLSLTYLFLQGRITISMILLNLVQLALFCRLHLLIHDLLGAEHYFYTVAPRWYDWVELVAVHVLRAVDLLDALGAYGIHLQNVKHQSTLAGIALFSMHIMVDIFLLGAVFMLINRRSASQQAATLMTMQRFVERFKNTFNVLKEVRLVGLALAVVLIIVVGKHNHWSPTNWWLWPLDNILRPLDFGDALQIFNWQLHSIQMNIGLATLAVFFRLMVSFYMFAPINRFYLFLSGGRGKTIDELVKISLLPESTQEEKDIAFKALARFGSSAVPVLTEALTNHDPDIRYVAAQSLGEIGSSAKSAISQLVKTLADEDGNVRKTAMLALKQIDLQWWQSESAMATIPYLAKTLLKIDRDAFVLQATKEALEKIDPAGEKTTPYLREALKNDKVLVRRVAASALNNMISFSVTAVPVLLKSLTDNDDFVRKNAANALTKLAPTAVQAIPFLKKALVNGNPLVRSVAATALGNMGEMARTAIPDLVKVLIHNDGVICEEVWEALMQIDPAGKQIFPAIPQIIKTVANDNIIVCQTIINALKKINSQWLHSENVTYMIPPIQKALLYARNDDERCIASQILGEIGSAATVAIPVLIIMMLNKNTFVCQEARNALNKIDPNWSSSQNAINAIPYVLKALISNDSEIRCVAIEVLEKLNLPLTEKIKHLEIALTDNEYIVRHAAAYTLGKMGSKATKTVPSLITMLSDKQKSVRYAVVEALGKIGTHATDAVPHLVTRMQIEPVGTVQLAIGNALSQIAPKANQL